MAAIYSAQIEVISSDPPSVTPGSDVSDPLNKRLVASEGLRSCLLKEKWVCKKKVTFQDEVEKNLSYKDEMKGCYICPISSYLLKYQDKPKYYQVVIPSLKKINFIIWQFQVAATHYEAGQAVADIMSKISAEIKILVQVCKGNMRHHLSLKITIIKAVKSINKYLYLLQLTLAHVRTNKHYHSSLVDAISKQVRDVYDALKEAAIPFRVMEIEHSLLGGPPWMLSYGKLLYESECTVLKRRKRKQRVVMVFERLFLLLKLENNNHYKYEGHVEVHELAMKTTPFKVYSLVHKQNYPINISCPDKFDELKTVVQHLLEIPKDNLKKVSQIASRETKEATNHANVKTTGKNEKNGKKLENTTKESTMKSGACEKNDTLRNVQNAHEEYILEEKQDEKYKKEENTAKNVIMEEKEEDVGESNDVRNDLDLNWNKDKKDKALQAISNADAVGMMDDKRDKNKGQNEKNESTNKDMMNDNGMNDEKNKMLETLSYENEVNMEKKPDDTKKNAKHAIENEKMKESCKNAGKNNNVGKNEKNAVLQVLCRNEEDMNVKKEKKRNIEEKSMEYEMEEDIETKECAEKSSDVKNVENKKKDENERMNKGEKEDTQEEFMQIENEERNKRNKEEKKESEETNAVEKILSF